MVSAEAPAPDSAVTLRAALAINVGPTDSPNRPDCPSRPPKKLKSPLAPRPATIWSVPEFPANPVGHTCNEASCTRPLALGVRPWVAETVTVMTSAPDRAGRNSSNRTPPGWNSASAWLTSPVRLNRAPSCERR